MISQITTLMQGQPVRNLSERPKIGAKWRNILIGLALPAGFEPVLQDL